MPLLEAFLVFSLIFLTLTLSTLAAVFGIATLWSGWR